VPCFSFYISVEFVNKEETHKKFAIAFSLKKKNPPNKKSNYIENVCEYGELNVDSSIIFNNIYIKYIRKYGFLGMFRKP
jgi:hypothetical protein